MNPTATTTNRRMRAASPGPVAAPPDAPDALEPTANPEPFPHTELITMLNLRLASAIDLAQQMKQAHWNVKGPHFIGLHRLFDEVHADIVDQFDLIAERIAQLGGTAEGTVSVVAGLSCLPEYPLAITSGMAHVEATARALTTFRSQVRSAVDEADALDDDDTAELFTSISRRLDKWVWLVEAHVQDHR